MITRKILAGCFRVSTTQGSLLPVTANKSLFSSVISSQSKNDNNTDRIQKMSIIGHITQIQSYSTTTTEKSLMEFFDEKKNWVEDKVKHGRPWKMDDLRLKSNTDLHTLWYLLHKERNMLLTMEEYYVKNATSFPSPERIAKVDESMENILAIVEERNVAYNLIETGETKSTIPYRRYNSIGFIQQYRPREYLVPWYLNKTWKLKYHYKRLPYWSKFYRTCYRVFLRKERGKILNRVRYAKKQIMKKHPDYYKDNAEFVDQHFKKEYGYTSPKPYHEMIRRPKPTDLPTKLNERIKNQE